MRAELEREQLLPPHVGSAVVTVGTFDGVHLGHIDVLLRLAARAKSVGKASVLVTFERHPLELLRPDVAPFALTTLAEKLAAIAVTGIDYVAVLPFTRALANHSAEQFVESVLRQHCSMSELLIGHDHGFGRGRAGDVAMLERMGARENFRVEVVPPVLTANGEPVSSTSIRSAVAVGDLSGAEASLGRPYSVGGSVVAGEARGRLLGFPTLNIEALDTRKLLPPDGVYAVCVETPRGLFGGMMNIGGRPTFGDDRRTIEAHLFEASGDFYGLDVNVQFVARLRETQRFDGVDALVAQLRKDETAARHALTQLAGAGNFTGSIQVPPSTL